VVVFALGAGLQIATAQHSDLRGVGLGPTATRPAFEFATTTTAPVPDTTGAAVTLDEVLLSVERNFPLLLAAFTQRDIAAGEVMSAEGAFDLNLRSSVSTLARGFYKNTQTDTLLEQPTPFWGTTFFGGYRLGTPDVPIYQGNRVTYEGGEFRGGLKIPILRDGPIDSRRAKLRQARIDREAAEPLIETQRLDFLRAAARTYWTAVAAARRLSIVQELLRLAQERNAGILTRVQRGDLPDVELLNNEQLIADRKARLAAAIRQFEAASIELSLFYRDFMGEPQLLPVARLPGAFPEADPYDVQRLSEDIQYALRNRPELQRLRLAREKQEVELKLAANQTLPGLDFTVTGSQDIGPPDPYSNKNVFEWELMVTMQLPIQQRTARGRVRSVQGLISQIRAQERFQGERITAEVQNAASALNRAFEQYAQARISADLAQQVAEAEERRFQLGQSNILNVNVQELAANDAAVREVDAIAEFFRALADFRAARGTIGTSWAYDVRREAKLMKQNARISGPAISPLRRPVKED
jgi:cobalt-zinc-cadmium efflux system outer membrane protein